MALDEKGLAFPVGEDTPIGAVKVIGLPFTFEQLCRALAAHAMLVHEGAQDMEAAARQIIEFAAKDSTGDQR